MDTAFVTILYEDDTAAEHPAGQKYKTPTSAEPGQNKSAKGPP